MERLNIRDARAGRRVVVVTGTLSQVAFSGLLDVSEGKLWPNARASRRRHHTSEAFIINSTVTCNGALIRRGVGEITGRCDAIKAFVFEMAPTWIGKRPESEPFYRKGGFDFSDLSSEMKHAGPQVPHR